MGTPSRSGLQELEVTCDVSDSSKIFTVHRVGVSDLTLNRPHTNYEILKISREPTKFTRRFQLLTPRSNNSD